MIAEAALAEAMVTAPQCLLLNGTGAVLLDGRNRVPPRTLAVEGG